MVTVSVYFSFLTYLNIVTLHTHYLITARSSSTNGSGVRLNQVGAGFGECE
jgi:hypothetical protein